MGYLTKKRRFLINNIQAGGLPSAYQQVEYIQSNRTDKQYLNIGLQPNNTDNYEIRFKYNSYGVVQPLFGARQTIASKVFSGTFNSSGDSMTLMCQYSTSDPGSVTIPMTYNNIYLLKKDGLNVYLNGSLIGTLDETRDFTTNSQLYLFTLSKNDGTTYASCDVNIYGFKYWKNDVLVREMVPCYRKSDNVAGMYDLVNGVFYTNENTGEDFTVGGDI